MNPSWRRCANQGPASLLLKQAISRWYQYWNVQNCVTCAKGSIYLNDARTNLFAELLQTIMGSPVIERYARRLPSKTDECCQCLYPCDCVIYCSKCPALGLKGVYFSPGNGCHGNLINCLGDCSWSVMVRCCFCDTSRILCLFAILLSGLEFSSEVQRLILAMTLAERRWATPKNTTRRILGVDQTQIIFKNCWM